MTAPHARSPLPHHALQVFHVARELLICVRDAQIRDAKRRDEATRAAKGTCLNIAEGAARVTRADKARSYAIARGEAAEDGAAIEIAVLVGAACIEDEERIVALASRVVAMLTRLIRQLGYRIPFPPAPVAVPVFRFRAPVSVPVSVRVRVPTYSVRGDRKRGRARPRPRPRPRESAFGVGYLSTVYALLRNPAIGHRPKSD